MKKLFVLFLIFSGLAMAQDGGKSGMSFLKLSFGARAAAMGDLGTASSSDVSALNYNPAIIPTLKNPEIQFMHNEWIQDVRSEYLGTFFRLYGIPLAFGVNTTTVSDIEVRTTPSENPDATFNANFFAASLSSGFNLFSDLYAGATVKYLYEGIFSDNATGLGFDLGLYYLTPVEGLSLGAAYRNLGSMNDLRDTDTKLPSEVRIGADYSRPVTGFNSVVTVGAEVQKYTEGDDTHLNLGAEVLYQQILSVRAGYQTGYDTRGLSLGLGVLWKGISFDYAFVPFKLDLGSANIVSLKYRF